MKLIRNNTKLIQTLSILVLMFSLMVNSPRLLADTVTQIVKVTSDAFPNEGKLSVVRDDTGEFKGLIFHNFLNEDINISLEDLLKEPQVVTENGAVATAEGVKAVPGVKVTLLSLETGFNSRMGGAGNLTFLKNGIFKTYVNFRFKLNVDGDKLSISSSVNTTDPLSDTSQIEGVEFNELFFIKNTFLGKLIGISKIVPRMVPVN